MDDIFMEPVIPLLVESGRARFVQAQAVGGIPGPFNFGDQAYV